MELLAHLGGRLDLLHQRTRLTRHKTLHDAIAWSYGLLTAPEHRVLRRLAVFSGGMTLEAATDVDGETPAPEVFAILMKLVDKSLVLTSGPRPDRYRLLEIVRKHGQERLIETGELEAVRRRHFEYYLGLAERTGSHQSLREERDNLRVALCTSRDMALDRRWRLLRAPESHGQALGAPAETRAEWWSDVAAAAGDRRDRSGAWPAS